MYKISELLSQKTEELKDKDENKRQKRWLTKIEDAQRAGLSKENIELMTLISDGGLCPKCDKSWKRIDWNNKLGKGFYYLPVCHCYKFCRKCSRKDDSGFYHKRWLFLEESSGSIIGNKCPNCGRDL